jgi:two-component system, chemotaxis family, sensor kinase CheA
MSEASNRIEAAIDDLSMCLVMIDPENLISLGELLEKVEYASETASQAASLEMGLVFSGIKQAIEAAILERVPDRTRTLEVVGEGVTLLQQIQRNLNAGLAPSSDLAPFVQALKDEAGIILSSTPPEETETAEKGSSHEIGFDSDREEALENGMDQDSTVVEVAAEHGTYDASQDQDLFFSFVAESMEHIESIEVNIISLENDPEDKETINAIFRPFHTIKGVSGFLNLRLIHELTHNVENLLDDARNKRIAVTEAMIDLILDAVDILKHMITDVKKSVETGETFKNDYSLTPMIEKIHSLQQGESPKQESEEAISPYGGLKIGEILIDQGLLNDEELEEMLQGQEDSRLRMLGEIIVEKGIITADDLEEALRLQLDDNHKKLGEILIETGRVDPAAVSAAVHDQEILRDQKLGELLVRSKRTSAREVTGALREQKKAPESRTEGVAKTVKVDTIKLDTLVDMVGELVIAQSLVSSNEKVKGLKDQKLLRDMSHMARITSELQRTAMGMRMVPIRQTFQKMIRLVRDLSRKSGKMVDLNMSGEETEIDRNMVEEVYDPLVHMVRNSMDHGIEQPSVRQAAGKAETGSIHLKAFHQGGNVVIQIIDDGQGLNREKILQKAIERGLFAREDSPTDTAIFNMIFHPGFSTADKITDVSGRGVGMDVVKKTIEKLRGKVEVDSASGKGSTITIRLPLTLAIIDGMIVRVGHSRYIIPTVAIHESFRPEKSEYFTVKGRGEMIQVRKNLLPLVRLDRVLGGTSSCDDPTEALIIVIENHGERRCIMVDEVLGKQEVVIKSLGERLKNVRTIAGGSILGDGTVGLILDVAGLFEMSDGSVDRGVNVKKYPDRGDINA